MGLKALAAKWLAKREVKGMQRWVNNPLKSQEETLQYLLSNAAKTAFGKDHLLEPGLSYDDFRLRVPLRDYEGLRSYVDRIKEGEQDVLWPGLPEYFCKTSGTTSGTKYIPMTEHGIKAQIKAARASLMSYIQETGNAKFTEGKMIFLQGSPTLEDQKGIKIGRLSGIVAHHVPSYLQANRMPTMETNCIEDWEEKVDAIVDETKHADMRLISGIPPWVQMYFERLLEQTGKSTVSEIFPNLSVFAHGGVNYAPYKATMERLLGKEVGTIETYPASEGFIAFQDKQGQEGMLLNLDGGIFFEFIPLDQIHEVNPIRLPLSDVKVGVQYAVVLNTSSGLWGYVIGDTVKFTSTKPYRIIVSGRIKHFISAFGEHVIAEEVESAMTEVTRQFDLEVSEFHVAPQVNPTDGLPYHEWFVEVRSDLPQGFQEALDQSMRQKNSYYNDLIDGKVLRPLVLTKLDPGAFNKYMESKGKLGGQNKLPRLSNDRSIADLL